MTRQEFRQMADGSIRKFVLRRLSASQEITVGDREVAPDLDTFRVRHPNAKIANVDGDSNPVMENFDRIVEKMSKEQLAAHGLVRKRKVAPKTTEPEPEPESEGDREE